MYSFLKNAVSLVALLAFMIGSANAGAALGSQLSAEDRAKVEELLNKEEEAIAVQEQLLTALEITLDSAVHAEVGYILTTGATAGGTVVVFKHLKRFWAQNAEILKGANTALAAKLAHGAKLGALGVGTTILGLMALHNLTYTVVATPAEIVQLQSNVSAARVSLAMARHNAAFYRSQLNQ